MFRFYIFFIIILLSSCAGKINPNIPKLKLPSKKIVSYKLKINWWKAYNDKNLDNLIKFALKNNEDLKLATVKIEEAQNYVFLRKAERFPEFNINSSFTRYKTSEEFYPFTGGKTSNDLNISLNASYEVDLWNKLKNKEKYSIEMLLSEKANREIIKISLISAIIQNYFSYISISKRINIAKKILQKYKEILNYRKIQLKHGLIDEIEIKKIEAQLNPINVLISNLKEERTKVLSSLSLLLGRNPYEIFSEKLKFSSVLPKPLKIPSFIPSKLLSNRPDIIKAEKILKASEINVAIAKSLYFPNIFLTAKGGVESPQFYTLIRNSAKFWDFGTIINQTLIDFGRRKQKIKIAKIKQKEALINYIKTVKIAFNEVYEGFQRYKLSKEAVMNQKLTIKNLKNILKISKIKFEKGATDLLPVLYSQLNILKAEYNLIQLENIALTDQIFLFKALGGGYDFYTQPF